jgi:hypothetical protein
MNLKLKYIIIIIASILLSACAMENRKVKSSEESFEVATDAAENIDDIVVYEEEIAFDKKILYDAEINANSDVEYVMNKPLVNQKLQEFYDLLALQNHHPEFTGVVAEQLKNYTKDSVSNFKTDKVVIIKNIRQLGYVIAINDTTQKIKLTYTKMVKNIKTVDTIYALIFNKTILIDNEPLTSSKVRFSKN